MQSRSRIVVSRLLMERTQGVPRRVVAYGVLLCMLPMVAHAQSGSPFDTGFTAIQTLFTGTIAKVASLVAIVIGGYILFKIPDMTHSLFSGGTGGHDAGLGVAMMAIRAAM